MTVREFEISSRVCSRFRPQDLPLLRFWKMDPSLLGVMQTVAVTVRQFEISSRGVQHIQATWGAFAAILADGSVVTWGDADCGGDSSAVQDQLRGVQQVQATGHAFVAVHEDCGGDSLAVQKKPRLV